MSVPITCVCLLLQDLYKAVCGGGRGVVKDICYEVKQAETRVDWFAHHALVNVRERESFKGYCGT